MGDDFRHFFCRDAVVPGVCQVISQGMIEDALGHQNCDGYDAPVAERKLAFSRPDFAEQDIIVQYCSISQFASVYP